MRQAEIRKLMLRIAKEHEPIPQPSFHIRQFGAVDPSALEGFRRFTIYTEDRIDDLRRRYNNEDVYVSVYTYESEDFDNSLLHSPYYIDLDDEADPSRALAEAKNLLEVFRKLKIPDEVIHVYWSGAKGFHIEVPLRIFGGTPQHKLNRVWKTLTHMIDDYLCKDRGVRLDCVDWGIYDRRRLWRLPNSVNSKTGLYKIPLSIDELENLSINEIKQLAKNIREVPEHPSVEPLENLQALFRGLVSRVESEPLRFSLDFKRGVEREPYKGPEPPCITHLLDMRMKEGDGRNDVAIILFSFFFNFKGLEGYEAQAIVEDWSSKQIEPLPSKELSTLIKSSVKHGYIYGCSTLEKYHCNRWECPLITKEVKAIPADIVERAKKLQRDPQLLKRFDESTDKWIVKDYAIRRLCLRDYASAYTDDPLNLSLLGRDSIGKTYVALTTAKLLPPEYIWFLGGLSPTALANDYGQWNQVERCFYVDLNHKILLFLEPPNQETLAKLKPILSHDREEITYKVTQKTRGGRLRTITTHVKGWPALVMCAAKTGYVSEYSSRWLTATPEISEMKTREAMLKLAEIQEDPEVFRKDIDIQIWRAYFTLLKKMAPIKVKIPYAGILAEHFVLRGPETMRVFRLFLRLIKSNAALHTAQREMDDDGYVQADYDDFIQVLEDFKPIAAPTFLGVSGDALTLHKSLHRGDLTVQEIWMTAREVFGSDIPETTLRDLYIKRLVKAGLLTEEQDPLDKRRKLYTPTTRTHKIKVFDDEEQVKKEVEEVLSQKNIPVEG